MCAPFLQEETRRIRALKHRHQVERDEIAEAHSRQFSEFHAAWDKYIAEFDAMAAMYTGQMQEKHLDHIAGFQEGLHVRVKRAPFPLWTAPVVLPMFNMSIFFSKRVSPYRRSS